MQKIIYVDYKYINEVNTELSNGWKVVSVNPVSSHTQSTYHMGAYVVLEKNEKKNPDFLFEKFKDPEGSKFRK